MSRAPDGRSIGRFVLSLATFAGIAVGLPLVLAAVARQRFGSANPLAGATAPWDWSGDQVGDGLSGPLDDDTVLDLLIRVSLVTVWTAVAVIVAVTVAETVHVVRHRGIPRPSIRGLGWAQHVGRFVAVGLVVVLPLTASRATIALDSPGAVAAWTGESGHFGVSLASATSLPPHVGTSGVADVSGHAPSQVDDASMREHVVEAGESVYSIAAGIAGGDEQQIMAVADAIVDANLDAEMGGGQRFTNAAYIEVGWVLRVPGPADTGRSATGRATPPAGQASPAGGAISAPADAASHVVEAGDTLWDIAAARLGDAAAWPTIWELNAGRDMGDGRTFDDPHLIVAGWTLDLPDQAAAQPGPPQADRDAGRDAPADDGPTVDVTVEPDRADHPTEDTPDRPVDEPVDDPAGGPVVASPRVPAVTVAPTPPSTVVAGTPPVSPAATVPPATSGTGSPAASTPSTSTTPSTTSTTTVVPGGGGIDGDVGIGGEAPEAPRPIRLEHAALVAAGILALVGVRRRQRLRAARPRSRVPEPLDRHVVTERRLRTVDAGERAARIDVACRAIAHALVDTSAQIGWVTASADGDLSVRLTAAATLPRPWTTAPVEPSADGGTESPLGPASLHPAPLGTAPFGREWSLGAEVPIELLSDDARQVGDPCLALVQIGIDDAGADVLVDLEAAGTLAVDAGPAETDDVITAIASALASSLHAETAHLVGASLVPAATLDHRNAHRVDSADAALELAGALVGTTAVQERTSFELRSLRTGGEAWEPAIVLLTTGDDAVSDDVAATLPGPGHGVALVAPAASARVDGPPVALLAVRPSGWTLEAFGATLALTPLGVSPGELTELVEVVGAASEPLLSLDDLHWSDDAGDHDEPDGAEQGGATLFEPMPYEIVVGLLGSVTVTDRNGAPGSFERSKTVELIAWLATHRERATRTGARTALWELDVRDATFANVVSEARRALGRLVPPPQGDEWVGRTLSESLPLHEAVVTDAQLVQQRVDHARLQPPGQAVDTLRPAVEMVRDLPFSGTSYLWPDAEGITSNLVLLAITACTEFAGHALSLGDTDGVFWATGQGLRVLPGHEELIGLRMRAHARSGDLAGVRQEWEAYERVIVADTWSDGEPAPKLLDLRHALLSPGTATSD